MLKKLAPALLLACSLVGVPALAEGAAADDVAGLDDGDDEDVRAPRFAQGRGGDKDGKGNVDREARRAEMRERVKAKIQTYVTVELSTRAGLDEKKSMQLGNAIKVHLERKHKAREAKKAEMQKLKALLESKGNDAAVKSQLNALLSKDGRDEQTQAFVDDTSKFLTPTEQAKIVIALPEVMKDTRKMIREARQERRGGRGRRGGGGGQE